jgi:flagellar basal-body rod protein FlgF
MQEILALTLRSMHQDMQRLDRIGSNLANALTPGYQRDVMSSQAMNLASTSFGARIEGALPAGAAMNTNMEPAIAAPLLVQTDIRPGALKSTGQALDVALTGPGYFEVQTEAGPAYTRQGNFHVDGRGRLVTAQGLAVMGKGGEIYMNGDHPVIDGAGNVYESEARATVPSADGRSTHPQAIAQLKVVQVDDPKTLRRLGEGLMTADGTFSVMKEADFEVRQGFLEASNVSSMQEMVQMMQTMRHFESMQKLALGYDDMTSQAIRKLGDLS